MAERETYPLEATFALTKMGARMVAEQVRREHPGAPEVDVDAAVNAWYFHRPGALRGGCRVVALINADDLRALRGIATEVDWDLAERSVQLISDRGFGRGCELSAALHSLRLKTRTDGSIRLGAGELVPVEQRSSDRYSRPHRRESLRLGG